MRVLALLMVLCIGCTSVPLRSLHATVIDRRMVMHGPNDPDCFITIEYTDASGALVHDEILVPTVDYNRFRNDLYVCVTRTALDGYRLTGCE